MCTSIILYRKSNPWPIIIGSNRDENLDRASTFPGRHWSHYPNIIAGKDLQKKGLTSTVVPKEEETHYLIDQMKML